MWLMFVFVLQQLLVGEVVLNSLQIAEGQVPASVIAGKLNGGIDVWTQYLEHITFKPFELVRVISRTMYTVSQLEAIELFNTLGFNCPYVLAKRIRPTEKSLEYVKSLYETNFKGAVNEPCDGVVYCSQHWVYPFDKSDNGKTDYGKYAWKPSNEATSVITGIQ